MSSPLASPTGDTTLGDQQPPLSLEPSVPEVLTPQPELPPSPPPELPASPQQPQPIQPLPQITEPQAQPQPQSTEPAQAQPPPQSTEPQAQPPPQSTEPQAQPPPQSTEPQTQPPPQSTEPQAQPPPQSTEPQTQPPPQSTEPQAQPPPQSTEPQAQPPPQSTEPQAQPPPQSTEPQAQPPPQSTEPQAQPPPQSTEPQAQPPPQSTEPQAQPPPQSTEPQAQPQQPAEPLHQTAVTGVSPGPVLTISAPPAYSEVIKNQPRQPVQYLPQQGAYPVQQAGAYPAQHVHQLGYPQYLYPQQPGVQPAIQTTTPYMLQTQFQPVAIPRPNYPGPHDFFILSVISTTILALLNLTSLVFGIPVIIFSGQSKDHKHRGDYPAAKKYANVALSLMIVNIIYVLGGAVFGIGMSLGLHYQYLCTRSYSYC